MSTATSRIEAPSFNRSWKRGITTHAIKRLRERLLVMNDVGRSDRELAALLDLAVDQSICLGPEKPKVILDGGKETTLVSLSSRFPETWAMIRPNNHPKGPPQAIITVLTTSMVNDNIAKARWVVTNQQDQEACRERAQAENVRVATPLAAKLRGVEIAGPSPSEKSPAPVPIAAPAAAPSVLWLVCFPDGGRVQYEEVEPAQVMERVNELLERAITPRVFKEVSLRVRVDPSSLGALT